MAGRDKLVEERLVPGREVVVQRVEHTRQCASVIAGPRTLAHWQGYLDALDYDFTARDEAFLDKLVAPGHPSSPGYSDPRYPPAGRPTWTAAEK